MLELIFIATACLSLLFFYLGVGRNQKVLLLSTAWLLIIGTLAYSGFFENTATQPFKFLVVFIGGVGLSVYFYRLARNSPLNPQFLLAIHVLRIPVELVLYQLYVREQVPLLMTFRGYNFDILVGISAAALLAYWLITHRRWSTSFTISWNLIGLLFLTAIVVMAILSAPLPIQQLAFDQPNVAVLQFPYVFLPAYIVPVVCLSHLLAIRHELRS